jgi:SAM-dependent methyltransferase
MPNLWSSAEHALDYLSHADKIPHRTEGERALLEYLPNRIGRVLDLGSGDGRLLALVRLKHQPARATALDFSETMLSRLHDRFDADASVDIVAHNMDQALPNLGQFDAVVSCFAIHHLSHERKRLLYREVYECLAPGGVFCNLEHVASPTPALHRRFLATMDILPENEDPSNKLLDVETQLSWLRGMGCTEVDCHWKWMELALLIATKPLNG